MTNPAPPHIPLAPIWDETIPGRPCTHILIIGVGRYQHLNGGIGPLASRDMGLGQLTSPQVSAREFAAWMINHYYNPGAPRGSVFLLLSEHTSSPLLLPDGSSTRPEVATIGNIEHMFDAWLRRVQEHPDNMAIFYYCGHGVLIQGDLILLAEDYGEKARQPFDASINFEVLHKGMANQHKGPQCFFVDACSNIPQGDLDVMQCGARGFCTVVAPMSSDQTMLVLRATAPGNSAYGIPNQVSRFTDVLMDCFRGRGCNSTKIRGEWIVTTNSLVYSVNQVTDWMNKNVTGPIQIPNATRNQGIGPLHYLDSPPVVPIKVQFNPVNAIDDANLTLTSRDDSTWKKNRPPKPGNWEPDDVRAGSYILQANFSNPSYRNLNEGLIVVPPGPMDEPFVLETSYSGFLTE